MVVCNSCFRDGWVDRFLCAGLNVMVHMVRTVSVWDAMDNVVVCINWLWWTVRVCSAAVCRVLGTGLDGYVLERATRRRQWVKVIGRCCGVYVIELRRNAIEMMSFNRMLFWCSVNSECERSHPSHQPIRLSRLHYKFDWKSIDFRGFIRLRTNVWRAPYILLASTWHPGGLNIFSWFQRSKVLLVTDWGLEEWRFERTLRTYNEIFIQYLYPWITMLHGRT